MLHLIAEFFQGRITSLDGALAGGKADSESESEPEDGAPAKAKKMPALLVPVQVRLFYIYRSISCESCSQFDSLPLPSLDSSRIACRNSFTGWAPHSA